MGHLLTCEGLRPDLIKIKTIKDMPKPTNKEAVEWILGFVNYQWCFIQWPKRCSTTVIAGRDVDN